VLEGNENGGKTMGILKKMAKFSLVSIGTSFVAPRIFSEASKGVRPLAKEVVKGGLAAYEGITEKVGEVGRQVQDFVVEVKQEMQNGKGESSDKRANSFKEEKGAKARKTVRKPRVRKPTKDS
jgi:hypothetical protein